MFQYETSGTCAELIDFDIEGGKLKNVKFTGGCNGNLKAIGILVEGMDAAECAGKLRGLTCGSNKTSCGGQLARAIEEALAKSG